MKKLLLLVLFAIAFCAVVETAEDVEAWSIGDLWNGVKNFVSKGINFLKKYGIWQALKSALGTVGAAGAGAVCQAYGIPYAVCSSMVAFVAAQM